MRPRGILVAWAAVAVAFVLLLGYELAEWRALSTEGVRAASERERLIAEIRLREQQLVAEMRAHSSLLQDMQWGTNGGDPSGFLARLAELAREKHVTVLSIGPPERQATPQFSKSWHTIQVVAPYRDIRDLAAQVERDRGILEDVRLEAAPANPGAPAEAGAVQARFRLVALELSPQAKKVIERAVSANGRTASGPAPGASPLSPATVDQAPIGRDPFAFAVPPPAARSQAAPSAPVPAPPPRPPAPLELSAIASAGTGYVAIVNNQIVRVGDEVSGHRVEEITSDTVVLREPDRPPRTLRLPELGAAPPAPRR